MSQLNRTVKYGTCIVFCDTMEARLWEGGFQVRSSSNILSLFLNISYVNIKNSDNSLPYFFLSLSHTFHPLLPHRCPLSHMCALCIITVHWSLAESFCLETIISCIAFFMENNRLNVKYIIYFYNFKCQLLSRKMVMNHIPLSFLCCSESNE